MVVQQLDLLDVEGRTERIGGLVVFVGLSGVFKLSSKMELLLDLVLVLKNSSDPLLKKIN